MRNPRGDDMYAFMLTVMAEGRPRYQIQVGNPVPAAALPLLYPGNVSAAGTDATKLQACQVKFSHCARIQLHEPQRIVI